MDAQVCNKSYIPYLISFHDLANLGQNTDLAHIDHFNAYSARPGSLEGMFASDM